MAARCREFIEPCRRASQTIVGERGVKLSGGQRQRIAIARAFLQGRAASCCSTRRRPRSTSKSEEAIRDALDRLMRGRTVIAIAHRLSTLRGFDRIVVLQAGEICRTARPIN